MIFVFSWEDPAPGGFTIDAHDAATGDGIYRLVFVPGQGVERIEFAPPRRSTR